MRGSGGLLDLIIFILLLCEDVNEHAGLWIHFWNLDPVGIKSKQYCSLDILLYLRFLMSLLIEGRVIIVLAILITCFLDWKTMGGLP